MGGGPSSGIVRNGFLGTVREKVDELASAEGFHYDDGDAAGGRGLQAGDARLGSLVQVVVLDLAEVPVVVFENLEETGRVPVIGESDVAYGAGPLFLCYPVYDAESLEPFPLRNVGEHMHEVVVDPVGPQTAELFREILFDGGDVPDHILRELGRDVDLVPDAVPGEDLAQGGLTAGIQVCRVVVVDSGTVCFEYFLFGLVDVDSRSLAAESHATVSERGQPVAVSVSSVLHAENRCNNHSSRV